MVIRCGSRNRPEILGGRNPVDVVNAVGQAFPVLIIGHSEQRRGKTGQIEGFAGTVGQNHLTVKLRKFSAGTELLSGHDEIAVNLIAKYHHSIIIANIQYLE